MLKAGKSEAGRTSSSSNFDQRNLREYYAKSFEISLMERGAQSYITRAFLLYLSFKSSRSILLDIAGDLYKINTLAGPELSKVKKFGEYRISINEFS